MGNESRSTPGRNRLSVLFVMHFSPMDGYFAGKLTGLQCAYDNPVSGASAVGFVRFDGDSGRAFGRESRDVGAKADPISTQLGGRTSANPTQALGGRNVAHRRRGVHRTRT